MILRNLILVLLLEPSLFGCVQGIPDNGDVNNWELYRTLAYYKYIDRDSAKYAAARYLIGNMLYHCSSARMLRDNDTLRRWMHKTDSMYYATVHGLRVDDFPWDTLHEMKYVYQEQTETDTLPDIVVDGSVVSDAREMTFDFLTSHIDNAFYVWRESPYAKGLTFDEFKEYILPYRSVIGYGFNETGRTYHDIFAKYVRADTTADLRTTVYYYHTALQGANNKQSCLSGHLPQG